jgi:cholesterol oxidase
MGAFDYDYIIVGSGFGGSVAALRLTEKGYRVAVIEMGRRFGRQDFAKTNWDTRRFLWQPKLGCYGIMQMTLLRDVFVLHGAGVGGGSLVYANTLLEPPPEAFADRRWIGQDWRQALAPHYAEAKRMLGVVPAPRIYAGDEVLRDVAQELGRADSFHPTNVGVFFGKPGVEVADPFFEGRGPSRAGCTHCGACMVGCRVGAKNTLDQNYLFFAERGGARIVPEQRVTGIEALSSGGYRLTMERSTGLTHPSSALTARGVVLAAGVLGTVPLLLRSKRRGFLPKLSNELGNYVRTNSEALLAVRARDASVDYSRGIAIAAGVFVDDTTHIEIVRYNEGSDALGMLATVLTDGGGVLPRPLRWLFTVLRHPWQALRCFIPFGWAKRTAILLVMQPVDNFLRLVEKRRWLRPWSRKVASSRATAKPIPVYLPLANEVARRMARRMNGIPQNSIIEVLGNRAMTAHILGGCPIGNSPDDGVIDLRCRVFGYDELYVVDGAAVPANLGVNPSLTITAIAEHAMSFVPPKSA